MRARLPTVGTVAMTGVIVMAAGPLRPVGTVVAGYPVAGFPSTGAAGTAVGRWPYRGRLRAGAPPRPPAVGRPRPTPPYCR
jgi:hypothetical protein